MKKTLVLLTILLTSVSALQARGGNLSELNNKIYDIQDLLDANGRKINRRDRLAQDILTILEKAESEIAKRVRGGRGQGRRVDQKLVKITLDSCRNLGTWSQRRNCFSNNLASERGVLGAIQRSCSAVSQDSNSANCFTNALQTVQSQGISFSKIATSACGNLGTWSDRRTCFTNFFDINLSDVGYVVGQACGAVSVDSNAANCFQNALNSTAFGSAETLGSVLVAGCGNLGAWSDRKSCFKAGVNTSAEIDFDLSRYTRGCQSISNDSGAAQCYTNALSQL